MERAPGLSVAPANGGSVLAQAATAEGSAADRGKALALRERRLAWVGSTEETFRSRAPTNRRPVGSEGASMKAAGAYRAERLALGRRRLPGFVGSPTDGRAVLSQPASLESAGADRRQSLAFRRIERLQNLLPLLILVDIVERNRRPANGRTVLADAAGMEVPAADCREPLACGNVVDPERFAFDFSRYPAMRRTVLAQAARMEVAAADRRETFAFRLRGLERPDPPKLISSKPSAQQTGEPSCRRPQDASVPTLIAVKRSPSGGASIAPAPLPTQTGDPSSRKAQTPMKPALTAVKRSSGGRVVCKREIPGGDVCP